MKTASPPSISPESEEIPRAGVTSPASSAPPPSLKQRALVNIRLLPLFLMLFGIVGTFAWSASLAWAEASNMTAKLLFGGSGLLLIAVEGILAYLFINHLRWVTTGERIMSWKRFKEWFVFPVPMPLLPFKQRLATILLVAPSIIAIDIGLIVLTIGTAWAGISVWTSLSPMIKLLLGMTGLMLIAGDAYFAYLHVAYAYWIATGYPVKSWRDLKDWSVRQ